MKRNPEKADALSALTQLSLAEVEQALANLDADRAALSLLRRSLAARERIRRRQDSTRRSAQAPHAEGQP